MKYPSFFLVLLCCTSQLLSYSLVFVHIGDQLPPHLTHSIDQARLFNPDMPLYVLASNGALSKASGMLNQYHVISIGIETLTKTVSHQKFSKDTCLAQGFWRHASERLLYLNDFIQQYDMYDVFHLENDNMLYVDLAEIMPVLKVRYPGIAAVFDSDERCIPGFVYVATPKVMDQLATYMADNARRGKNDMEIIEEFRRTVNENIIDNLPLIMEEYGQHYELRNTRGHVAQQPLRFSKNAREFKALFDGAAFGQYLGGTCFKDKGKGFVNETTVFNTSHLTYEWHSDEQGRVVPYARFADTVYKIINLHIHSKNTQEFSSRLRQKR